MDRKHLNRVISRAMRACKQDTSGRARAVVIRLNHARTLLDAGMIVPAQIAVQIAFYGLKFGR